MGIVIRCLCRSVKQERCYVEPCTIRVKEGGCTIQTSAVSKEQSNWLNEVAFKGDGELLEEG